MSRRKSAAVEAVLVVAVSLSVFACSHGSQKTTVQSQKSSYLPIHLAAGTFDPLSESDRMALPREWTLDRYPNGPGPVRGMAPGQRVEEIVLDLWPLDS